MTQHELYLRVKQLGDLINAKVSLMITDSNSSIRFVYTSKDANLYYSNTLYFDDEFTDEKRDDYIEELESFIRNH